MANLVTRVVQDNKFEVQFLDYGEIKKYEITISRDAWEKLRMLEVEIDYAMDGNCKLAEPLHLEGDVYLSVAEYLNFHLIHIRTWFPKTY